MTIFRRLGGFALSGFSGFFVDAGLTETLSAPISAASPGWPSPSP
jgi:hypothetical protein